MQFEQFIEENKVIIGEKDIQKAKALIKMSEKNIATAQLLTVNDITSATVLVINYEALREIVEAICLKEGLKVYSHEAFTAYLQKLKETRISEQFDRYRKLRNGANYYGKEISIQTAIESKEEIKKLCNELKKKYLSDIK